MKQLHSPIIKVIFILFLFVSIKGTSQNVILTEDEKKTAIENFKKILDDVKNNFKNIKKGESDLNGSNQLYWLSNIYLFPKYRTNDYENIMELRYNGNFFHIYQEALVKPHEAFLEILLPILKAKGFKETKVKGYNADDFTGKAFITPNCVVQITTDKTSKGNFTNIFIGKIPYYYEKGEPYSVATTSSEKKESKKTEAVKPEKEVNYTSAKGSLTDEEKKTFIKNLHTVLASAPTFEKLKTNKIVEYNDRKESVANISLFPKRLYEKDRNVVELEYQLVFTKDKQNFYSEYTRAIPDDFINTLENELAKKSFEELKPIVGVNNFFIRIYRLKDLIICIDKTKETDEGTLIRIGKISYYSQNSQQVSVKRKLNETQTTVSTKKTNQTESKEEKPKSAYPFYKKSKYGVIAEGTPISGDTIIDGTIKFDSLLTKVFVGKFKYQKTGWGDNFLPLEGTYTLKEWNVSFTGKFLQQIEHNGKWATGNISINNINYANGTFHNTSNYNSAYYFIPNDKNKKIVTLYKQYNTKNPEVVYNEKTIAEEETYAKDIEEKRKGTNTNTNNNGNSSSKSLKQRFIEHIKKEKEKNGWECFWENDVKGNYDEKYDTKAFFEKTLLSATVYNIICFSETSSISGDIGIYVNYSKLSPRKEQNDYYMYTPFKFTEKNTHITYTDVILGLFSIVENRKNFRLKLLGVPEYEKRYVMIFTK